MRFVSRLLTIVTGVMLLLLLAGMTGWLTRHHWVPFVVNHSTDGVALRELRGLTISHREDGFSVQIKHLKLATDGGLLVAIDGAQLTKLPAFLRHVLRSASNRDVPARSELHLSRLTLLSTTATQTDTSGSASPSAPSTGSPPATAPDGKEPNTPSKASPESSPAAIGEILHTLRTIPVRHLKIDQLYWTGRFDGYLSVNVQNAPDHQISAQVLSDRCTTCAVDLKVHTPSERQASIQLQLTHENVQVSQLRAELTGNHQPTNPHGQNSWQLDSQLELSTEQLGSLLQQLKISLVPQTTGAHTASTMDWNALARSLTGDLALTLRGEVPNTVNGAADLNSLSATLHASALSATLPEGIAGAPLTARYTADHPLTLQIRSISPLVVESINGEFDLQLVTEIDPAHTPENTEPAHPQPLLDTGISLTTDNSVPGVKFDGNLHLTQLMPLLASRNWQEKLGEYRIGDLSGQYHLTGHTTLPSLTQLLAGNSSAILRDLSVQLHGRSPTRFQVSLLEKTNPLATAGWQQAQVQATLKQPVTISANTIPGTLQLGIPLLEFEALAVNDKQQNQAEKQERLTGELRGLQCQQLPQINCALTLNAQLTALDLSDSATELGTVRLEVTTEVKRPTASEALDISLSNLNFVAGEIRSGPIVIATPELFTQKASCQISAQRLGCDSSELAISIAPLSLDDNQVSGAIFLKELKVENKPGTRHGLSAQAQFRSDSLALEALGQFKTTVTTEGSISLRDGLVSGESGASSGPIQVQSQWQHNLDNGAGELQLTLPETKFSPGNALSNAIRGLPADIVDGTLSASAKVDWPDRGRGQLSLAMANTGIRYDDSFAVGVNTAIQLQQSGDHWITRDPARVSVDTVDAGVAVKNLNFLLSLQADGDIALKNFAAELLEGALTSDQLTWNQNGEERHSDLQFTGISIGALAQEMESQNFAASGILDATLPLTTDRQGVTIEDGTLQSRAPGGRLRYYGAFSQAMLGSNPQLKLLAGALEDYTYRDIRGSITYPLSGDLTLNLKLTGRSKAIDANRDLIINLNLENNIPTMLRSLQASRDLTDVLEKRVE